MAELNLGELYNFIVEAGSSTYAGGGLPVEIPQRYGHIELEYSSGDYIYRDSYAGHTRSQGSEYVIYRENVIWENGYGGGMINGKENLADECFSFIKKAMLQKDISARSFRGPKSFKSSDWEYKYSQEGDISRFTGHEEIFYKGELVFFHDVNGGVLR